MRLLHTTALLALLSTPALALNDSSIVGNSGIANNGTIQNSTLNNGSVASGAFSPTASSTNVNTAVGGSSSARQTQSQNATSSVRGSGNSSVSVQAPKRNPVATAFAAPLVAADDTCMGSSSAGGQGVGFGLSIGSTWTDENCVRRKDARELHNMGYKPAAIALLCQSAKVRKAMEVAGTPCAGDEEDYAPEATSENEFPAVPQSPAKH